MKNEILSEAIGIANRRNLKLATREHVDALYQAWQRAERLLWGYRRQVEGRNTPACTGTVNSCTCAICESIRADERQDKMDSGEKNG